jgi:hypothetical protein
MCLTAESANASKTASAHSVRPAFVIHRERGVTIHGQQEKDGQPPPSQDELGKNLQYKE